MKCTDPKRAHRDYNTGAYQMNASNYLHLHLQKNDIRHFHLAVLCRHDLVSRKTTVICVNFHSHSIQPIDVIHQRVLHALEDGGTDMIDRNPLWVNIVYIGQVLQWWKVTLECFAGELNCYVQY